ncbi:MAG: tetratricopeptide repeat protein [Flavobacteriales bacterium]|nr:hypothetical protein [Flavobacteriales bacterium]MBX2959549.1 tetratricopeptide repeat protein [Flavobacteriales bacterium]
MKKTILFILFVFLLSFNKDAKAQNRVENSLKKYEKLSDSLITRYLLDSAHSLKFVDFPLAIQFAEKSIVFAQKEKDILNEANAYNVIGICNHLQNHYQIAFQYYQKALNIFIKNNNQKGQSSSLINIGVLYKDQKNYHVSTKYFLKAKKFAEASKDSSNLSAIYNNIGINYQNQQKLDSAIYFYLKALEIREKLNNIELLSNSYSCIATVYSDKKEFQKSLEFHLKSLQLDSLNDSKRNMVITLSNISSVYSSLNRYDEAINSAKHALKIAKELNYVQMLPDIYFNLYHIYYYKKEYKYAFDFAREYISIKDSISNVESEEIVMEMQAKYDSELKENEILMLNTQNELQENKIAQQKNFTYFLSVLIILLIVIVFIAIKAYRLKTKTNNLISIQNDELKKQKSEIHEKSKLIEIKSLQLEHVLKEVKDSINYAKKIQDAILPRSTKLNELNDSVAILYLPKDVVSGDFYWFEKIGNKYIFATADCTGHGVPGAFMSMIGVNNLNQIIVENKITSPDKILKELNIAVKKVLKQDDEDSESRDGMDISISCFDLDNKVISYAGAFRPLIYIRNNELFEIKASRNPIGGSAPIDFDYELHQFEYQKDDVFYMFSDGFPDQFGGSKGKKFMNKQLKEVFMKIYKLPPLKQKELLKDELEKWRGNNEQIDDVLVMCVKIS